VQYDIHMHGQSLKTFLLPPVIVFPAHYRCIPLRATYINTSDSISLDHAHVISSCVIIIIIIMLIRRNLITVTTITIIIDTANDDCKLTKSISEQKIHNTIKTVH